MANPLTRSYRDYNPDDNVRYTRKAPPSFAEQTFVRNLSETPSAHTYDEGDLLSYMRNELKDRSPENIIGAENPSSSIKATSSRLINIMQNGRVSDRPRPYHGELEYGMTGSDVPVHQSIRNNMPSWTRKMQHMHDLNKRSDKLSDTQLIDKAFTTREARDIVRNVNQEGVRRRYGSQMSDTPQYMAQRSRRALSGHVDRDVDAYDMSLEDIRKDDFALGIDTSSISHSQSRGQTLGARRERTWQSDMTYNDFQSGFDVNPAKSTTVRQTRAAIISRLASDARETVDIESQRARAQSTNIAARHSFEGDHNIATNDIENATVRNRQSGFVSAPRGEDTRTHVDEWDEIGVTKRIDNVKQMGVGHISQLELGEDTDFGNMVKRTTTQVEHTRMAAQSSAAPMEGYMSETEGARVHAIVQQQRMHMSGMTDAHTNWDDMGVINYRNMGVSGIVNSGRVLNQNMDGIMHDSSTPIKRRVGDGIGSRVHSNLTIGYTHTGDSYEIAGNRSLAVFDYKAISSQRNGDGEHMMYSDFEQPDAVKRTANVKYRKH